MNMKMEKMMKYIDATTQSSLRQGVTKLLNLSVGDMTRLFISIYEDAEREPWERVRDFLSDSCVNETLEYIQMFSLSRRLDGTDLKTNNNREQLLIEQSPLSDFFKRHKVTFKPHEGRIDLYYKGELQPLDDEFRYNVFII